MNGKKIMALMMALMLLVGCVVGGTVAWLVAESQTVTNTFCIGQVALTLNEAKVNLYGQMLDAEGNVTDKVAEAARVTENKYKLIPGHNYVKDPTITVTEGSEECWVFVKITNGIANIEAGDTIAAQMTDWKVIDAQKGIYAYQETVDAREQAQTIVVFEEFTIAQGANVSAYADATITVVAYAVQAEGFATPELAWAAAPSNWKA